MRGVLQRDTACAALDGQHAGGGQIEDVYSSPDVSIIGTSGEAVNPSFFERDQSPAPIADLLTHYHRLGLSVIPASHDKQPLVRWKPYADRQPTETELRSWQAKYPGANWGAVTGRTLAVLDFDDRHEPSRYCLPVTAVNVTPRGYHYLYRRNGEDLKPCRLSKACELKTGAAFVILPPSVVNGRRYNWLLDLVPLSIDELAPLPAKIAERAKRLCRHTQAGSDTSSEYSLLVSSAGSGVFAGEKLTAFDARPEIVAAEAARCGIPAGAMDGSAFLCVLPGHEEARPSASLYQGDNGVWMYHDWHEAAGVRLFTLAEVFASQRYGQAAKLSPPELAVWHLRLLYEIGVIEPAEVIMPDIEADVPASVRRVYDGFRLLLGLRWRHTPGEPTAFSCRFAGAWCGVSFKRASEATQRLICADVIRVVGRHYGARRSCALFLPGDQP